MIKTAITDEMERRGWTPYRLAKEMNEPQHNVYSNLRNDGMHTSTADRMMQALGLVVVRLEDVKPKRRKEMEHANS